MSLLLTALIRHHIRTSNLALHQHEFPFSMGTSVKVKEGEGNEIHIKRAIFFAPIVFGSDAVVWIRQQNDYSRNSTNLNEFHFTMG